MFTSKAGEVGTLPCASLEFSRVEEHYVGDQQVIRLAFQWIQSAVNG